MKASNAESKKRTEQVLALILEGKSSSDIYQFCAENYLISERQSAVYISKANRILEAKFEEKHEKIFNKITRRYELLFQKSYEIRDYRGATTINEKIAAFHGIGGGSGETTGISIGQLCEILSKLDTTSDPSSQFENIDLPDISTKNRYKKPTL